MSFRMPAEWAPHERCWMAWPCREGMWSDEAATARNYADVAHAIRRFEPVSMLVPPDQMERARDFLGADVVLVEMVIDDSWVRDSGPIFVVNAAGDLAGACFTFNAWGGKYPTYDQDALVGRHVLERLGRPAITSDLVAEGGGLCVDGEGTLLTTDTCFPNPDRNPHWSRADIDAELVRLLGVETILWLPGDPLDAETDGHVDGLAVFVAPGKVAVQSAGETDREPYLGSLRAALENSVDARGRRLELVEIPEAAGSLATNDRFCLSYINFYIANGAVIAPRHDVPTDDVAHERLQTCFPDREIVMVAIPDIAEGGGGIHCITQQQPAV